MSLSKQPFTIEFTKDAERDIKGLPIADAQLILKEIQNRLCVDPFKQSKTRIKRLVGFIPPLYRLRVGDFRTYYRIVADHVVILTILHKKDSQRWLKRRN